MGSQQFCLKWNNHQSNMLVVFEQLLSNEALVDVTLACEGHSLKAHKMVLSACSPFFQALFVENPCKHPIVILKDMRYMDLKAIVEFMYKGEVNVSQDQLSALLKTAETLKVKGLAEVTGDNRHGLVSVDGADARTISTARPESPPMSKRKRGRPRRRSPSDSNKSDSEDQGAPPATRIKAPESPEIIEDGSMSSDRVTAAAVAAESPAARTSSAAVLTAVSSSASTVALSNKVVGGLPASALTANSMSSQHTQDSVGDDTGVDGDDADFEVEPSNLMEQSMTTENVPVFADVASSSQAAALASESQQSHHTGSTSDNSALVPVPASLPSDISISSQLDIKPSPSSLIPPFDEQAISPVVPPQPAGSADGSSSAMMMAFTDMSGVPAIAGPSNYHPDKQQSTPSHGSDPPMYAEQACEQSILMGWKMEQDMPEPEFLEPDSAEPVFEPDPGQRISPEPAFHTGFALEPVFHQEIAPGPVVPEQVFFRPDPCQRIVPGPDFGQRTVPEPVSCQGIAPEQDVSEPVVSKLAVHGSDMDKPGKPVAPGVVWGCKRWPKVYSLPEFSAVLQKALLREDASFYKPGRSRLKTLLIDAIVEDLAKYRWLPTPSQYCQVFNALKERFPFLREKRRCLGIRNAAQCKLEKERLLLASASRNAQGITPEPAVSEPASHGSAMDKPGKPVAPGVAGGYKRWSKVYSVPQFSPKLHKALLREDASFYKPGQTKLKTLLIDAIARDISKYNMWLGYPTRTQYSQVSNALEERFPFLREKGRCGRIVLAVRRKLEKERQLQVSNSREVPDGRRQVEPGVPEPKFPEPDAAEPDFERDPCQRTSPEPALHRGFAFKPVSCKGIAPEPAVSEPAAHGSDMDKPGKPVAPGVAGGYKRWPKVYSLPQFSPGLHNALLREDVSFYTPGQTRLKTLLINAIARDISNYNMGLGYPTQTQYSQVLNALEERFPFLREKGRCGRIVLAVQRKLEKERQLLVSNSKEVPDGRQQTSAELGQPGEEALTMRRIADALRGAVSQQSVDLPLVKRLMRRTLRVRQELMKRASVASVLEDYPALKLPGMMLQDAQLHFGIDIFEAIQDKMPSYQARALLFLEEKEVVLDFEHLIKDDPEKVSLLNLPVAFDEKRAFFFTTEEEVTAKTPIIQVTESRFSIFVDGVEAVCNIETTAEAVGTLMAAYYLFSIEYPAELTHTMEFIEHFFCDLGSGDVTESVKRLARFLKE